MWFVFWSYNAAERKESQIHAQTRYTYLKSMVLSYYMIQVKLLHFLFTATYDLEIFNEVETWIIQVMNIVAVSLFLTVYTNRYNMQMIPEKVFDGSFLWFKFHKKFIYILDVIITRIVKALKESHLLRIMLKVTEVHISLNRSFYFYERQIKSRHDQYHYLDVIEAICQTQIVRLKNLM